MKATEKNIKNFLEAYGYEDAELADVERLYYTPDSDLGGFSEMAINLGYVWLEKYSCWIDKNNSLYSANEQIMVNDLIDEKFELL